MTGMPLLIYNPYSNVNFHAPFTISPKSLYINYKLEPEHMSIIKKSIKEKNPDFDMVPIKIKNSQEPQYFLSLNIYNCTSPLFLNDNKITRFEINTYVKDGNKNGTLILDYISNSLSMDPVNLFKERNSLYYHKSGEIYGYDKKKNIYINLEFEPNNKSNSICVSDDLSYFSDYIFYPNGIYDKLYYDTSLLCAKTIVPKVTNIIFKYMNISLTSPDSVFYFDNSIQFVGSMWDNIKIND